MRSTVTRATLALAGVALTLSLLSYADAGRSPSSARAGHAPRHSSAPLPVAPLHGTIPGWLHTAGTRIVDTHNRTVRLDAVNWYGADGADFVPGGLDVRPYMSILRTIKYLGFNTIRLPLSNELIERNPVVTAHLDNNPWFRGWHALSILDAILHGARQVGLMVVLVDQKSFASGSRTAWSHDSLLWYNPPHFTQQQWIKDWVTLAKRYRTNPAVIGFDLRNEPHSDGPGLEILNMGYLHHGATWGPFNGVDQPATDWRLAAERAGDAILRVNPHALIIVEGIEVYPYRNPLPGKFCPYHIPSFLHYCADLYWWGGNLEGAKKYPVVLSIPHHLVYSPHEYGPNMHGQRWITPRMTQANWQKEMYQHWGYLLDVKGPNAAPVWVGEFGTFNRSKLGIDNPRGDSQGAWFHALITFLRRHPNVGWAYWPINGTRPGSHSVESYGLLTRDWSHISLPALYQTLRSIQK